VAQAVVACALRRDAQAQLACEPNGYHDILRRLREHDRRWSIARFHARLASS